MQFDWAFQQIDKNAKEQKQLENTYCTWMKQNCHFQRGELQYKHPTKPLSFKGTSEGYNFVLAHVAQKLVGSKV